jgi:hypothetical protein
MADEVNKTEELRKLAFELTPNEQYRLAYQVAENVGYVLVREDTQMQQAPKGCICPPTSEQTCKSLFCGRGAFQTMT